MAGEKRVRRPERPAEAAPDITILSLEGNGRVTYQFAREEVGASELIGRLSQRFRIQDLAVREPDIEATVRRIYEERLLEQ